MNDTSDLVTELNERLFIRQSDSDSGCEMAEALRIFGQNADSDCEPEEGLGTSQPDSDSDCEPEEDLEASQPDSDSENSDADDDSLGRVFSCASPESKANYLKSRLDDMPDDVDLIGRRFGYIMKKTQKLTGFNFSKWVDYDQICILLKGGTLYSFEAERVVEQFYILHPNLKKHSITGLTPALVKRTSILLSKTWKREELRLTWETFGPFFSMLALCDSSSSSDDEFRGMIRLAMAHSKKLALETTTLKDRMKAYILETIPIIKTVLDCYVLRIKAEEKFKTQSDDPNLIYTDIIERQTHTPKNKRSGGDTVSGCPKKKQRRCSEKVPDIEDESESSMSDSD